MKPPHNNQSELDRDGHGYYWLAAATEVGTEVPESETYNNQSEVDRNVCCR